MPRRGFEATPLRLPQCDPNSTVTLPLGTESDAGRTTTTKQKEDFGAEEEEEPLTFSDSISSRVFFPSFRPKPTRLTSRRNRNFGKQRNSLQPSPCDSKNKTTLGQLCSDDDNYPEDEVRSLLQTSGSSLKNKKQFNKLFSEPCRYEPDVSTLRVGFSQTENPLCISYQSYEFPTRARNVHGMWRYIINIPEYQQGVTVEVCDRRTKGKTTNSNTR